MLVNLTTLTDSMRAALRTLAEAIENHDGISPLNESALLSIAGLREGDFFFLGSRNDPHGFVVGDLRDETLLLAVHPNHRRKGYGTALLEEARAAYPDFGVWAFGTLPGAAALAERTGLVPQRELLQMSRALTRLTPSEAGPVELRTFDPADAAALVAVNAAAFAHHPEQGRLTVDEFHQLSTQDWFDPEGLFTAWLNGQLVGFHWTKQHDDGLGEVYVIAVAPGYEGKGIGRTLLAHGLAHLANTGNDRVHLFVEAAQHRTVELYRNAGFQVTRTDTFYRARTPK